MIEVFPQRLRRGSAYRTGARARARSARRLRFPRRVLLIVAVLLALLAAGWLWLRDSSLVAVKRVTVIGTSGRDAGQVRAALVLAARNMTTLDVSMDQLRTAVAPFPVVKDLRVTTQFPHGMQIRVIEQIPVGVVVVNGRRIAVAGDATLLNDSSAPANLPTIPLRAPPGGSRLTEPDAVAAVTMLGGAPYQLLARVTQVAASPPHGLVAQLRNGPSIYFGDASRIAAKWTAAAAVLADPGSAGAVYVDVSDPERAAAGGVGPAPSPTVGAAPSASATGTAGAGVGAGARVTGGGASAVTATGASNGAAGGPSPNSASSQQTATTGG